MTQVNGNASDVGQQATLPSGAKLTLSGDGSFNYDPNNSFPSLSAGQSATDTFNYTASDGILTDDATVTVTITGVNDMAPKVDALLVSGVKPGAGTTTGPHRS